MPRKSADHITEHRITLGLKERELMEQAAARAASGAKISAITQMSTAGAVVLGAGALAIAGYAFYRWCGLPVLSYLMNPENTSNLWYNYTVIGRYVRDGNTAEAYAENDRKLQAEIDRTNAILNDPNSTENQKAIATQQQQSAVDRHAYNQDYIARKHEENLNRIRAAGESTSWLFGDTWKYVFGERTDN